MNGVAGKRPRSSRSVAVERVPMQRLQGTRHDVVDPFQDGPPGRIAVQQVPFHGVLDEPADAVDGPHGPAQQRPAGAHAGDGDQAPVPHRSAVPRSPGSDPGWDRRTASGPATAGCASRMRGRSRAPTGPVEPRGPGRRPRSSTRSSRSHAPHRAASHRPDAAGRRSAPDRARAAGTASAAGGREARWRCPPDDRPPRHRPAREPAGRAGPWWRLAPRGHARQARLRAGRPGARHPR